MSVQVQGKGNSIASLDGRNAKDSVGVFSICHGWLSGRKLCTFSPHVQITYNLPSIPKHFICFRTDSGLRSRILFSPSGSDAEETPWGWGSRTASERALHVPLLSESETWELNTQHTLWGQGWGDCCVRMTLIRHKVQ